MVSKEVINLKKKFTEAPVEHFGHLTFGELKPGDKFIYLPMPNDTTKCGFKAAYGVLYKMVDTAKKTAKKRKNGKAFSMMFSRTKRLANSTPIILITTDELQ